MRCISIIECHPDFLPRSLNRIDNRLTPRLVYGHRFLRDNIASQFQSSDDIDIMCSVHSGDNHFVWLRFGNHLVEIDGFVCWYWCCGVFETGELIVGNIHTSLIRITEPYNERSGNKVFCECCVEEGTSASQANHCVSFHGVVCWGGQGREKSQLMCLMWYNGVQISFKSSNEYLDTNYCLMTKAYIRPERETRRARRSITWYSRNTPHFGCPTLAYLPPRPTTCVWLNNKPTLLLDFRRNPITHQSSYKKPHSVLPLLQNIGHQCPDESEEFDAEVYLVVMKWGNCFPRNHHDQTWGTWRRS